jgi:hypothetical protein
MATAVMLQLFLSGREWRGTLCPVNPSKLDSSQVVIDDRRKNEFHGRDVEVFESPAGSGPVVPLVLKLFSNELRRLWLLPLLLVVLLESVLVLDLDEVSLLWLFDRSLMVGLAWPSHTVSCNGSGSKTLFGTRFVSAFDLPDFLGLFGWHGHPPG